MSLEGIVKEMSKFKVLTASTKHYQKTCVVVVVVSDCSFDILTHIVGIHNDKLKD